MIASPDALIKSNQVSMRLTSAALIAVLAPCAIFSQTASGPKVRFETNLGNIDVNLLSNTAPLTVANFLRYVNRGDYSNSVFHRSVANFVIQGGGFRVATPVPVEI